MEHIQESTAFQREQVRHLSVDVSPCIGIWGCAALQEYLTILIRGMCGQSEMEFDFISLEGDPNPNEALQSFVLECLNQMRNTRSLF